MREMTFRMGLLDGGMEVGPTVGTGAAGCPAATRKESSRLSAQQLVLNTRLTSLTTC